VEYASGVNSHKIFTWDSSHGSESLRFGWSRKPYTDLKAYNTKELKATATIRHNPTGTLKAVFTVAQGVADLNAEMKVTTPDSVELKAGFRVAQPGSEELLGYTSVRHSSSTELVAGFTVVWLTGTADLLAETEVRHSTSTELKAEVVVQRLTGEETLLAGIIIRHSSSRNLRAGFYAFTLAENLRTEFTIRRSTSIELKAGFEGQVRRNLKSEFITRPAGSRDLRSGFVVRHSISESIIIVDDNWDSWANYWVRFGTGFISTPVIQEESGYLVINTSYEEDEAEGLIFGWNQHPDRENTSRKTLNLKAGFDIA
jgi:hypothetical protein